jgi:AmiR/NasT family two-component response regulator
MEQADILVAGDESVATRSLTGMITRLGHRVIGMAASGEEALCRVMEHSPDIVVMDIEAIVPHEAIEAAAYLNQIFNTPVVFVAGAVDERVRALAAVAEPSGFLARPVSEADLERTLDEAVNSDQIYAGKAKGPRPARRLTYRKPTGREHGLCEPAVPVRRMLC